jgi:ATP-dependent DNA helicase RecG
MARFRVARLPEDADVLERAHACAAELLAHLDEPEYALLADALRLVEASPVAA